MAGKAINDSLNLTISVSFLVKVVAMVGLVVGGWYQIQMGMTEMQRTVQDLHTEVTILNTKMAEMEREHLEELETHVELKETQLQHLEKENRSLMQKLGLKKPS
jgi:uncharacterized protein HemX|tara:strand:+ start:156 stop:467 length:312 start_codon:yes stop_codon:yes gene_type:complete